jgi:L-cysteine S-thiosulfotransferase
VITLATMLTAALTSTLLTAALVVGDGILQPLTSMAGDATRGRAIVVNRQQGLCLLCHSGPTAFAEVREQGNLASNLEGTATRWTAAQLRLRVADARRLDPNGLMPSFYKTEGLAQVGAAWQGKSVLTAQEVEDVLAFLLTLK